jgi:hypothetical protein
MFSGVTRLKIVMKMDLMCVQLTPPYIVAYNPIP